MSYFIIIVKGSIIGNLPDGLFAQYLEFKSKSKALLFAVTPISRQH